MDDDSKQIKVILVGESGVGKTCIIHRYIKDRYTDDSLITISNSLYEKTIQLNDKDNSKVTFDLWDTCGQEKYRDLSKLFFKNSQVVIFVYDYTNKQSFNEIKTYWYKIVKENIEENNIVLALVANKCDLFDKEEVSEEEGLNFAKEINASFKLISAYSGLGIEELFKNIGMRCLNLEENENLRGSIKLDKNKNKKYKKKLYKCCYFK